MMLRRILNAVAGWWDGLVFLIRLAADVYFGSKVVRESVGEWNAQVAMSTWRGLEHSKGTIIVLPGLSPAGYDDTRIIQLARAIAGCGFTAIIPSFERSKRMEINHGHVEDLLHFCRDLVTQREDLCPLGQLSVAAACISAGFATITASVYPFRAVLNIGAFASVTNVVQHLFGPEAVDDYGRNAVLYNFLPLVDGDEELRKLLFARLQDTHYEGLIDGARHYESMRARAAPETAAEFDRIQSDPEHRNALWRRLSAPLAPLAARLSPVKYASSLQASRIVLVHGSHDDVIPASESVYLHRALLQSGRDSVLCVTPLLDHSDKKVPGLGMVREVYALADAFGRFFEAAVCV